jgi:twitching motility two-component system response regulator PilH
MSFQFCWEFNSCAKPCVVRDLKLLFCWRQFTEEEEAGIKACSMCAYRAAWEKAGWSAKEFPVRPPSSKGRNRRKTVLVVDDEPYILYALEEAVRDEGFECVTAADGEAGLTIARGIHPDLLISDIIMPRMNGYELCRSLKGSAETNGIPIILVTVRAADKDRDEAQSAGADAYIIKPFTLTNLREQIVSLIGGSAAKD